MKHILIAILLLISFSGISQKKNAYNSIVKQEFVFTPQSEHSHGSSIVALPNGDFLVAWFQGSGERTADDVRIMGARLEKGKTEWSKPFLMADTPGLPDCNPVLFINNNKLFLVWIAVQGNRWEGSILRTRTTTNLNNSGSPVWEWQDNILIKPGEEFPEEVEKKFNEMPELNHGWAEYAPLYDDMIKEASKNQVLRSIGWMTRIKPLFLSSGRIILPLYSDGYNLSICAISDDDGESWKPSKPIVGRGPIQPALAVRKNGDIVAYMRDSGDAPARVHKSISKDNGESWSYTVKTDILNEASVELLVLNDGRWAFFGNDLNDGRYRLVLMLSDDEGETWKWKEYIENDNKQGGGSYSYPSLIQTEDGLLHITYSSRTSETEKSIKHIVVNTDKIR
ncbi:MAG: exo-alpha-sialidase [Prolixibacteraceae bacterium]|nr:exo-alpha-sialidase [Prolixibacteraceae bacterium]MBT6766466.1 exo-alpha-sialidase [Prolixibacteraceae bacterium]MBT6998926.1 exo-alpha-sialidase [Prolixibacteraceae bacterium]MBT7395121.1 exo-alpha-sialidase [Prolixibacteraceae bacterium]